MGLRFFSDFWGIFFPKICPVCRNNLLTREDIPVCKECQELLQIPHYKRCYKCGNALDTILDVCSECTKHVERPWVHGLGVLPYHGPAGELVRRYKYYQDTALSPVLAWILTEGWTKEGIGQPDYIIPIPISYSRFLERGYNQCEEVAKIFSQKVNIPLKSHFLLNQHHYQHQAGLNFKDRQANIKGSFYINKKFTNQLLGKHILLIDDVLTTGATLAEATRVLSQYDTAVSILTITRG